MNWRELAEARLRPGRAVLVKALDILDLMTLRWLDELGFSLAGTVSQIADALELIGREPVDCALLDVNLGSEKIDPVADVLAARGCPFIFTTGYGRSGIPAAHAERPVLQKPFRMDDLAVVLKETLAKT